MASVRSAAGRRDDLRGLRVQNDRNLQRPDVSARTKPKRPSHSVAIGLLLISLAFPSTLTFYLGDSKFYVARIVVAILLIPALVLLLGKRRRFVASDLFVSAASCWMIVAIFLAGRGHSLSSTLALALEFWGGYIVARAYVFGRAAIESYVRMLKPVLMIAIAAAVLDHLSGRLILNDLIGRLLGVPLGSVPEYRAGLLRAMSIFAHPILYGTFCTMAGAVFLYARQWTFVGLSLFGCLLAMSSAPLLVFGIVLAVYGYDALLKQYPWRWRAFTAAVAAMFAFIYLTTNNPTSWIIAHLTLDPSTGYFRQATWDRAFYNIGLSPLTGYGFDDVGNPAEQEFFDNASVDAVWLVVALRFGIPIVPLLLLANIASFYGPRPKPRWGTPEDAFMCNMRTGFTLAIWALMLAGLTVHYWNTMWLVWGICIGIRASFQEEQASSRPVKVNPTPRQFRLAEAGAGVVYRR